MNIPILEWLKKETWVMEKGLHILIILLVIWFLMRLIKKFEARLVQKRKSKHDEHRLDPTTIHILFQLLRLLTLVIVGLVTLQVFGIPISGVLAFGGVGGIAIGFAAKDLLANFFGGLMIFLDQPFKVGDWIRSPDRQLEGDVEYIGWRLTRIRTFEKRPLYVPNAMFSNIIIENPSRMTNRRIKATIGLRYDDADKLPAILEDLRQLVTEHEEIDETQSINVNFVEFGPSSLDILVCAHAKTKSKAEFFDIRQDVFFKVLGIIAKHGAQCAFPTTTLHVPDGVSIKTKD